MLSRYEVPEPMINSPFDEPTSYWHIVEGEQRSPSPIFTMASLMNMCRIFWSG